MKQVKCQGKMKKIYQKKQTALKILIVAFMSVAVVVFISIFHFAIEMQKCQGEAKNAEFALRLLATEYYGRDQRIYDPLTPDGLAEGVAEEVADLSGAEGELVLSSWDAARRAPRSFIYTKEKVVVIYNYDDQEGNCWKLYYQFHKAARPDWSVQAETPAAE